MGKNLLEEVDLQHLIHTGESAVKKAEHMAEHAVNQAVAEHGCDDAAKEVSREIEREAKQAAHFASKTAEKFFTHSASAVEEWGKGLGEKLWDVEP